MIMECKTCAAFDFRTQGRSIENEHNENGMERNTNTRLHCPGPFVFCLSIQSVPFMQDENAIKMPDDMKRKRAPPAPESSGSEPDDTQDAKRTRGTTRASDPAPTSGCRSGPVAGFDHFGWQPQPQPVPYVPQSQKLQPELRRSGCQTVAESAQPVRLSCNRLDLYISLSLILNYF